MYIKINNFLSLYQIINDYSSNFIPESSPNSLVRIRSRLIIDVDVAAEKSYTCVGQSGTKTAYATTTVYSIGNSIKGGRFNQHNITDLMAINHRINSPKKPRIVLYYSVIFEEIGSNVVLPCKAAGRPHPNIYWLDTNEKVINGQDPRIRMAPTGELFITHLRWTDMGTFTCVAHNALAKDAVATFVYPVLVSIIYLFICFSIKVLYNLINFSLIYFRMRLKTNGIIK